MLHTMQNNNGKNQRGRGQVERNPKNLATLSKLIYWNKTIYYFPIFKYLSHWHKNNFSQFIHDPFLLINTCENVCILVLNSYFKKLM